MVIVNTGGIGEGAMFGGVGFPGLAFMRRVYGVESHIIIIIHPHLIPTTLTRRGEIGLV